MKTTRLLGVTLVTVLLATACSSEPTGSDEDVSSPAPETESPADTTSSPTEAAGAAEVECPIQIGASLSLTGTYARTAADQLASYELYVERTNEQGGLLGCDIELVIYDDASTPETGARLYQRLITEDEVDLLMGPYSSAVSGAVMPVTDRAEMATVFPMAASDALFDEGFLWAFQTITPASQYVTGIIDLMGQHGLTTLAYLGEDSTYPNTLLETLEGQQDAQGFEIVHSALWPSGTTDFSAMVSTAAQSEPDVIIGATSGSAESILFGRALEEQGVSADIIAVASGGAEGDFYDSLGETAENIMASTHWEPGLATEGGEEFTEAFMSKTDREPGYHAATSYAGMEVLGAAVLECECLDQQAIREAIIDMQLETVFGPFDVDEEGAQVAKSSFIVQWMDGEKVFVWPESVATADPVIPHPGF